MREMASYQVILEMVDVRRWGKRASLLSLIDRLGDPHEGVYLGYRQAAEAIGSSEGHLWNLFREMQRERVLQRVEAGRGRRPSRWRINPNIRAWRYVPWLVALEHAELRLEASWRALAESVVPRSYGAAQRYVVPRSLGAAQSAALRPDFGDSEPVVPRFVPRSIDRGTTESCAAPIERGTTAPNGGPHTSSLESSMNSLARDEEQQQREGDVDRVCDAVTDRTGCDVFGTCRRRVAKLVRDFGADELLAEIHDVDPTGLQAPAFVEALGRRMRRAGDPAGEDNVVAFGSRSDRARELRAEVAGYRTQLSALRGLNAGDDEADVQALRDKIDRCEAELAALELSTPA